MTVPAIERIEPRSPEFDDLKQLYTTVFGGMDAERAAILDRHTTYPDWRGHLATVDGEPVGFIYGHRSHPDQWWHDQLVDHLARPDRERWLVDAYAIVELGVIETQRRRGLGQKLLDALLAEADASTAILTTHQENNAARRFYRALGWTAIDEAVAFPNASMVLFGIDLEADNDR